VLKCVFLEIVHEFSMQGHNRAKRARSVTCCAHFPTCFNYINVNSGTEFCIPRCDGIDGQNRLAEAAIRLVLVRYRVRKSTVEERRISRW